MRVSRVVTHVVRRHVNVLYLRRTYASVRRALLQVRLLNFRASNVRRIDLSTAEEAVSRRQIRLHNVQVLDGERSRQA